MQAQHTAPTDMLCKDKFLILSTVVPFGSTAEDITSSIFTKQNGSFIEENKLRVALVSPSPSPVLLPNNGDLKQEPAHEASILKENPSSGVENLPPPCSVSEASAVQPNNHFNFSRRLLRKRSSKDVGVPKDMAIAKDVEELITKLIDLEVKLNEAKKTIKSLTEERITASQERNMLQQELVSV
ncbi:hypothetical protein ACLOJK_018033 [Asimina triloba]